MGRSLVGVWLALAWGCGGADPDDIVVGLTQIEGDDGQKKEGESEAESEGEGACPRTQGYWKNHPEAWPVSSLEVGDCTFSQSQALVLFRTASRGDASIILAHQLMAGLLNWYAGADVPEDIQDAGTEAERLLSLGEGCVPLGVRTSSSLGQDMVEVAETLDDFNNSADSDGECGEREPSD